MIADFSSRKLWGSALQSIGAVTQNALPPTEDNLYLGTDFLYRGDENYVNMKVKELHTDSLWFVVLQSIHFIICSHFFLFLLVGPFGASNCIRVAMPHPMHWQHNTVPCVPNVSVTLYWALRFPPTNTNTYAVWCHCQCVRLPSHPRYPVPSGYSERSRGHCDPSLGNSQTAQTEDVLRNGMDASYFMHRKDQLAFCQSLNWPCWCLQ